MRVAIVPQLERLVRFFGRRPRNRYAFARFRSQQQQLIHEVAEVAKQIGVRVGEQAVIKSFDSIPQTMQSSTQRDAASRRTTEIEAIGGAILRAADRRRNQQPDDAVVGVPAEKFALIDVFPSSSANSIGKLNK
jgi:hypothetical protein